MKAISLWQPWATAIACGHKVHETRGWKTKHRGQIAIHAAQRWTNDERDHALLFALRLNDQRLANPPLGKIIAVANLVSITETEILINTVGNADRMLGNYGPSRYGWRLEDVVALSHPVPYSGKQGMFEIPDDIIQAALAETRAANGKRK